MSAKTKTTKAAKFNLQKAQAQDRQVERRNAVNHKNLALAIAQLIADDPYIEWEIVSNYCKRNNRMLVLREQPGNCT